MSVKKVLKFKSGKKASDTEAKKAVTVEGKITKGKPSGPQWSYYVSAKPEPVGWDMILSGSKYRGMYDGDNQRVVWRIPSELSNKMEAHVFFVQGRIIKGVDE
ncbi:MAG: hypothetical protein CMI34_00060 [Opitutales bacterium]|mgnify:CR=1 FL=1|nr:hypothetical protein [Opitutales bacterium]|tara:strand:+ start:2239 stop:2547 length:309 start_codon:yes stop_codon:yes gene_type:complete